jgi:hypothetical protein
MARDATQSNGLYGVMAEFPNPAAVSAAAEGVRDAGFTRWDVYAPFPIHGIESAMGLKPSRVSFFVGTGAFLGVSGAMLMQWWMLAVDYRMVIGGKPFFAWEQYLPITFEMGILLGSISAITAMFVLNKLPMPYHPLMKKERFLRVSDDRFVIAIESEDPKFDAEGVRRMLESLGGTNIDVVEA